MKGIVGFLIRMLVLNIVLVPIMVLGPFFYVIPFWCIVANPQDNFSAALLLARPALGGVLHARFLPLADSA
jgi:hypothetical protein